MSKLKDIIYADLEIIKAFVRDKVGSTYAEVNAACDENVLELHLNTWGGLRNAHARWPWHEMRRTMHDYRS